MAGKYAIQWFGDILVVKSNKPMGLLDMDLKDVRVASDILKRYVIASCFSVINLI